jgi:hypothetical protein
MMNEEAESKAGESHHQAKAESGSSLFSPEWGAQPPQQLDHTAP